MKQSKISTILWSVIISLGMILSLGSCREPEPTPDPQPPTPEDSTEVVTPEFSVEFKEATSSSLTFVYLLMSMFLEGNYKNVSLNEPNPRFPHTY